MRKLRLSLVVLPLLAGCSLFTQQPITPPASLTVQQKVEWSTSHCVRSVKERRPWIHKIFPYKYVDREYYVTIISPDGTALASFHDATWKSGSDYKQQPKAAREIYTERALKAQYLLQADNGRRYPYHVTALAADCESAILKPVMPIPPQPYLDISRMAVPQLGQSYRGIVGPVHAEEPTSLTTGHITVSRMVDEAVSASINLLFREPDGSFEGFTKYTETGYHAGKNLKPLQKFIQTNSSVRFIDTPKLKPGQPGFP